MQPTPLNAARPTNPALGRLCTNWLVSRLVCSDDCSDSDVANLIQEMEVMKLIGRHRNVLNLLGCCTQDGTLHRLFIVVHDFCWTSDNNMSETVAYKLQTYRIGDQ